MHYFVELIIVLIGMFFTAILFFRLPVLPLVKINKNDYPKVSIIIPARNEEKNLALLLKDLSLQTFPIHEIFCVDDNSEDATGKIVLANGSKLISLNDKPEGWVGKSWACQNGANEAKGDLLLFLDADVRFGKEGIYRLVQTYMEEKCTISVQPYHKTEKAYEQFSMLFNLIQFAANGVSLPKTYNIGLFGPIILISLKDYKKVGGHEKVKDKIIEDVDLGIELKKAGLTFKLFLGDKDISYRMYSKGFQELFQGWTKNIASGAAKTPIPIFLLVFFWISSLIAIPLNLFKNALILNWTLLALYSFLYIMMMLILFNLSKRFGYFQKWAIIFFPIIVLELLAVFFVSTIKKVFGLKVTWKGRKIKSEAR